MFGISLKFNIIANMDYSMKKAVTNITTETVKYMQKNMVVLRKQLFPAKAS